MQQHIAALQKAIQLETKAQEEKYALDQQHTLKQLKAEGLALHPISITQKSYGYADYPEFNFRLPFPPDGHNFRDGAAIALFIAGETPVKGILLELDGVKGACRLVAGEFPDWIEDNGVGIKLYPDKHTQEVMEQAITRIAADKKLSTLYEKIYTQQAIAATINTKALVNFFNGNLNESQQEAINAITQNESVLIVHGPPGTGKTTTLVEAARQLVQQGHKILVTAPSNTAVDNFALKLIQAGIKVLRVGNTGKVHLQVMPYTPEGNLKDSKHEKEIKKLRIRAAEMRKMALQYKRSFGKSEREQRQLLYKEVKQIRKEIIQLQQYNEDKLYEQAQVVLGTPVGLVDSDIAKYNFHTLFIDEAGQCLQPLAWAVFPFATNIVLAGDHLQLPPTVLSQQAADLGFNVSILEAAINNTAANYLLKVQYRMREAIAGFSNEYFYNGALATPMHLQNKGQHIVFIDTAGAGYTEQAGADGISLQNTEELDIVQKVLEEYQWPLEQTALISPYNGQVSLAKNRFSNSLRVSTIDSFQGQEMPNVIISLVRCNSDGIIGFLSDYRRMNVALTRAKENLVIIGCSATIGNNTFFGALLKYVEQNGLYKSVWEYLV
jgi:ATP-dependent RNA/DNA helicase IGHMBP2